MADDKSVPRVTVESEPAPQTRPPASPRLSGAEARRRALEAKEAASSWVDGAFPGHRNAVFFGLVGLVAALLIFWIGFFRVLFVAVFVVCGVAFGQWLDGDARIVKAVKKLFGPSNDFQ